ncbi:SUMF1/EgtB/PvdO family nonheme iron enzyme [Aquimarina gracilis]|uniref:SUMF1/EgtB/PvdO family nonheme iron enzyme n=1 Tax=Aquimarina gracilis TaxID=874422 RepID=A0ABU5ZQM6_9FLAO|nr:SUMF1/EgtB/PvdO family nonheme iron enzyme [Aquimarina gracilis]MEB3344369.1 SUMF1/EgtB/PvdO family nonheme iron enzyme [Aquimarina gracilis]
MKVTLKILFIFFGLFQISCENEQILYPVTVQDFSKFVEATGYITDAEKFGWSIVQQTVYDFKTVPKATWRLPDGTHPAKIENPVTQVSYNDAVAYCQWSGTRLPTYNEYWKIVSKDHRRINVFFDSILPAKTVNLIGNVWEITTPENSQQIRLAGGSYLCNKNTCDGTNRKRELIVDPMTGNIHVSFAVLVDKKDNL